MTPSMHNIAVATGLKPFWQPRAPARARAPERCHSSLQAPQPQRHHSSRQRLARVSSKGEQLGGGGYSKKVRCWCCSPCVSRLGAVEHDNVVAKHSVASDAVERRRLATHGYGVCSPGSERRDRVRAGGLRHGHRRGRAGELATRSTPGTTPGLHTS